MAVDKHPSRMPSPPRRPPATSTTDGQPNTVGKTMTGDGWMEYGSRNGKHLSLDVHAGYKAERAHDFEPFHPGERAAPKAGKAMPNEGTASRASRPGDEKGNGEPG